MKKLNNKGYMLVEIIIASVIAFSVAYYLINLTIKFKNQNSDLYNNTIIKNDKVNITKNIMNDIEEYNKIIADYETSFIGCNEINTLTNYNEIENACNSNKVILNGCSEGKKIGFSPFFPYYNNMGRGILKLANIKKIEISNNKTLKYINYEIDNYYELEAAEATDIIINQYELYTKQLENGNEFTNIDCTEYNNHIIKIGITNIYSNNTEYIKITW